ncbi:S-adenosyl-L-methionine-dependent methyltransferase [Phyllosticta citrichinensis]|uniref:S-adenosyl-L-methionine-dependent methyltransferase n=1 Tax=Phyllosticta citrichinensis TaxID=1130410 RepID=A0ABR1XTG1_9PEZI
MYVLYEPVRTIASSITTYRYENGRRYHAYRDGAYYQPNDERQAEAGKIENHLWLLTLNDALFLAPLADPQRVLDVGTGTGLWAIDMADRYPACEVIGTDLSPTQVPFAPPNVRFEIDDCYAEWTVADWPRFYRECRRHLHAGSGFVEQLEFGVHIFSPSDDPEVQDLLGLFRQCLAEAGDRMGKTMQIGETMVDLIREAGFVHFVERRVQWPIGAWDEDERAKEIGRWNWRNWEAGMEGWVMALLTRNIGMQNFKAKLLHALKYKDIRAYHHVQVLDKPV